MVIYAFTQLEIYQILLKPLKNPPKFDILYTIKIRKDVEFIMSENEKNKKYFIKDEELTSIDQDRLSAKDIVKNLKLIIDNTKPPFSIAVTGKSGVGKSSVINLLTKQYEKNDEFNVNKINIWKKEESLKTILEDNCAEKIKVIRNANVESGASVNENAETVDKSDIIDQYFKNAEISQNDEKDEEYEKELKEKNKNKIFKTLSKIGKLVLTFLICFIITTVIFVFMEYLQSRDVYKSNDVFFVENTYLNYRENFVMIMIFTIGLTAIAYIVSTLLALSKQNQRTNNKTYQPNSVVNNNAEVVGQDSDVNNFVNNINMGNVEDTYEIVKTSSFINPDKKNIIIIEDIDKLSAVKMIKTLEEIKYCTEYENCVFIVPFDEIVLKKAIDARNQSKSSATYRPLKFEKVLEKVFQFRVHVPRLSSGNIKDYTVKLVQDSIPSFIEEYCGMDVFEKVIRNVLVYKNVVTPRHVKKLLNAFINNKLLISNKIQKGKIDESIAESKNFDLQLAKISVIQADFEEFYDLLFTDFDYLEALTQLYCLEPARLAEVYENINDDLKPFFANKYRPLMNFLVQTKNYEIENISTLMYLTKVKNEKLFKGKALFSYVSGDEDISGFRIQEVLELVNCIDSKEDLKSFSDNYFDVLFEKYKANASNKVYFSNFNEIVNKMYNYIDEPSYLEYIEVVANNYNYYPQEALEMFKSTQIEVPTSVMNVLILRMQENLNKDNYDDTFEFLRDNSDAFYEEDGNISDYVHFLVDNIGLATNPTEVIIELDENFTRIGKVYELNKNIKGLDNLDYDVAYKFLAKCLDNGDLDRMVNVVNNILSDEDSVEGCLNIEERMSNYNLIDVIECDVDDIISAEEIAKKSDNGDESTTDLSESKNAVDDEGDGSLESAESASVSASASAENAKLLIGNYVLLRNIIELCAVKQSEIEAVDTLKLLENALQNTSDEDYLLDLYEVLNKFDRMYFYDIRRDFNEIIYKNFHEVNSKKVMKSALDCTRYFKNTRLFRVKLTAEEIKFYEAN